MRFFVKVEIPVEAGNAAVLDGSLGTKVQDAMSKLKPEAAYFVALGGKRCCIMIINMNDTSEIPAIAEPFFLGLNAAVEILPCMVADDLMKGMASK